MSKFVFFLKKRHHPHRQVTISYVFLDSRVAISFSNYQEIFGIRFKFNPNLSTAGPHTKQTHTAGETPPKQPTHQKNEEIFSFFLFSLTFLFSFKKKLDETTGRADDSGTTDRLCSRFFFFPNNSAYYRKRERDGR